MKLHAPFVQLPLTFDAARLSEEVAALGEAVWRPHPQNFAGNSMLPLVAIEGDAANEGFSGIMRPTPELMRCAYLMQVLESFGATIGRTRLMRLSGGAEVTLHADQGYYWTERVRVHVPIMTQPAVRFECGDCAVHMAAGECWIYDTWRLHRVLNADDRPRIHLVCDTVGGERFWNLVDAGRVVDQKPTFVNWNAQAVPFDPLRTPDPRFESYNLPLVMTPWELKRHLDFLIDEMVPTSHTQSLRVQVSHFYRAWRALWADRADALSAMPEYRRLLSTFLASVQPMLVGAVLRNDLPLHGALMIMVAQSAMDYQAQPASAAKTTVANSSPSSAADTADVAM